MAQLPDLETWAKEAGERGAQYALKYLEEEYGVSIRRLIELAQADREGRCVVLPCKVGDTIYFVGEEFYNYQLHSGLQKGRVKGFEFDKTWLVWVHFEKDTPTSGVAFKVKDFGKTVFLTRAEAEAALRREQE